jgi:glycine/D-amino acid oxidase-like deaminating enzyme
MGYTAARDPFVGPVRSPAGVPIIGQWVAAGFSGHGMPRTFARYGSSLMAKLTFEPEWLM